MQKQNTKKNVKEANTPGRKTDVAKTVYQSMMDRAIKYVRLEKCSNYLPLFYKVSQKKRIEPLLHENIIEMPC